MPSGSIRSTTGLRERSKLKGSASMLTIVYPCGRGHYRVIIGKEQVVFAESGGKSLLVIGREDEEGAAYDLPVRLESSLMRVEA